MNVDLYTVCYNERPLIPIMMAYWKYLGLRKIYVYDNGSDDGSLETLSQYPGWIEVRSYDSNGKFSDTANAAVKNNCWKESDADFCIVADFDEIPWCSGDFREMLAYLDSHRYDAVKGIGVECLRESFPAVENGEPAHTLEGTRFFQSRWHAKSLLFKPGNLSDINYCVGAHVAVPVNREGGMARTLYGADYPGGIFSLHLKRLGVDHLVESYAKSARRLSEENKANGWGIHCLADESSVRREFNRMMEKSKADLAEIYRTERARSSLSFVPRKLKERWLFLNLRK